jgi:hypothetical protein
MKNWSRSDKISLIAIAIMLVGAMAAIIVIPEIRNLFGLKDFGKSPVESFQPKVQALPTSQAKPKVKERLEVKIDFMTNINWLDDNNSKLVQLDTYKNNKKIKKENIHLAEVTFLNKGSTDIYIKDVTTGIQDISGRSLLPFLVEYLGISYLFDENGKAGSFKIESNSVISKRFFFEIPFATGKIGGLDKISELNKKTIDDAYIPIIINFYDANRNLYKEKIMGLVIHRKGIDIPEQTQYLYERKILLP